MATSVQTFGVPATFGRFFGGLVSNSAGYALGTAAGEALRPGVQDLTNAAWLAHSSVPLSVTDLAAGAAQGQIPIDWAAGEAQLTGFNNDRFLHLVRVFDTGPGVAQAYSLWRRDLIDEAGFRRALKREAIEPEWINAMVNAQQVLLTPAELANARQQLFIDEARQKREASKQGIDAERADIQFKLAGLPPGPATGQDAANRGLIDRATFEQIVAEGHTKTKYTDLLWSLKQPLLSAATATTLRIKGWIDAPAQHALGALHGYTAAQMDQMYLAAGRPAAPAQMATAAVRGIDGPDGVPMNEAQFLKGIRESDIRPEWGPMLWNSRFLYPSLFQLTRLVTSGAIDATTGASWAHKARYAPEVVTALKESWATSAPAARDPHVVKAENQYWTALHKSYVNEESDATTVEAGLDLLLVPQANHARIVNLWNHERDLIRKQLTPAQIKKAYAKPVLNPATGVNWTLDDARAALIARGYSLADADTFLEL